MVKEIKVPIFGHLIKVFKSENAAETYRQLIHDGLVDDNIPEDEEFDALSFIFEPFTLGLIFEDTVTDNDIAHECVHVAYNIYDSIHVTLNKNNQELLAYMVGYLTEEVKKALKLKD